MATKKVKVEKTLLKTTIADFDTIIEPIITEKTMSDSQDNNKFAFRVKGNANKIAIKNAIVRIYGVKVKQINIVNVEAKSASRGSKYKGTIPGYKKAIVTLQAGETINLFAE